MSAKEFTTPTKWCTGSCLLIKQTLVTIVFAFNRDNDEGVKCLSHSD